MATKKPLVMGANGLPELLQAGDVIDVPALDINGLTEKTDPVGDDELVITDSEDTYALKKVLISNLPSGGSYSFKYGHYTLSSTQTSNLTVGNHVEFDTKLSGSLPAPSTGSGQEKGIFTLPAGKVYKITLNIIITGSYVIHQLYNRTTSSYISGEVTLVYGMNTDTSGSSKNVAINILDLTAAESDTEIDVRIQNTGPMTNISGPGSGRIYATLLIEEYAGY